MADISKIMLPNGTEYNIKDATARANQKPMVLLGTCSSASDAATKVIQIYNPTGIEDDFFEQYNSQTDAPILVLISF